MIDFHSITLSSQYFIILHYTLYVFVIFQQIVIISKLYEMSHEWYLQRRIQRRHAGRAPPCLKFFVVVFLEIFTP